VDDEDMGVNRKAAQFHLLRERSWRGIGRLRTISAVRGATQIMREGMTTMVRTTTRPEINVEMMASWKSMVTESKEIMMSQRMLSLEFPRPRSQ
jgi:hypothetical protein